MCLSVYAQPKPRNEYVKTSTPVHPWLWAQIDLIGPLPPTLNGNVYILTYVDYYTKWLELRPLKDKTAESVTEALDNIFSIRGPPLNIQSDNGKEFINSTVQNFLSDLGIKFNPITPYRPQSNGLVERSNRKIKIEMQLRGVEDPVWDVELPSIQLGLNLSRLSDGTSPFLRLHGWLLYRPAFLAVDFDPNAHKDNEDNNRRSFHV